MSDMVIHRGEDKSIRFTVKENSEAVDLTQFTAIRILIADHKKKVIAVYEDADIDRTQNVEGLLSIKLQRAVTATAAIGKLYAEIKTTKSIAGFQDNNFETKAVNQFATLQEAVSS